MRKSYFKPMLGLLLAIIMTGSLFSIGSITTFATEVNGDTIVRTSNRELLEKELKNAKNLMDTTLVGTLGGQYPEEARKNFEAAIESAKKVFEDNSALDNIISKELSNLKLAIEEYSSKRIDAPWDKYNVPETMPVRKREVRAAWVSSVVNIDWPSTDTWKIEDKDERIATQKDDLLEILDRLEDTGVNTVFFQVRPTSDVFYKSELAPWSYWLTGKYGEDPGFDPLQFAIDETHKRNMELHAWCNPYRVSMPASLYTDEDGNKLKNLDEVADMLKKDNNNIYAKHPEWIKVATNRFVLDPGIPDAQKYVEDCIMEIVNNYDVDGIHFDDYFYVGSNGGFDNGYSDLETYDKYADKTQFPDIEDWRRNNTYTLIKNLHEKINEVKPWVKFGISPAGVWRNKSDDPNGSDTNAGIPNYDRAYADTKKWVLEELIDYIAPQVYWTFANKAAPYGVVTSWWADLLKDNPDVHTQLWIGIGLYWLNPDDEVTNDPYWNTIGVGDQEIARQLKFNSANENIDGSALFTANSFIANYPNAQSAAAMIKNDLWSSKALVSSMPWKNGAKTRTPLINSAVYDSNGVTLEWDYTDENTRSFAVYRFDGDEEINLNNPLKLIDKVYKSEDGKQAYTDENGLKDSKYVVTALNRLSDESDMSNVISAENENPVEANIVGFDALNDITIEIGGSYVLPQKVVANYDDNTSKELTVKLDNSNVDVNKEGIYVVKGQVDGTNIQPSIRIVVSKNDSQIGDNDLNEVKPTNPPKTGDELPILAISILVILSGYAAVRLRKVKA